MRECADPAAPAPHSIYTCSKKTIQMRALAKKYHAPLS
jgi:hypothetical protein